MFLLILLSPPFFKMSTPQPETNDKDLKEKRGTEEDEILSMIDDEQRKEKFIELTTSKKMTVSCFRSFCSFSSPLVPSLVALDLSDTFTELTDRKLSLVSNLTHLKCLRLRDSRSITDEGLSAISQLVHLEELDISKCIKLTDAGVEQLKSLSKLIRFSAGEIGLSGGLGRGFCTALLGMSSSLESLIIPRTQLHCGISSLSYNPYSSSSSSNSSASGVGGGGVMQKMSEMLKKLRKIDLSGCSFDEREFQYLSNFLALHEIILSDCHVANKEVVKLLCKLLEARSDVSSVSIKTPLRLLVHKQNRDPSRSKEMTLREYKELSCLLDHDCVKAIVLSGSLSSCCLSLLVAEKKKKKVLILQSTKEGDRGRKGRSRLLRRRKQKRLMG